MATPQLTLGNFLPYRLSFTANLVSAAISDAYRKQWGLTVPEWRLIAVLAEKGEGTQAAIAKRLRMEKVAVSRAAISLVRRGLLLRSPHVADRRSHVLALSAQGRQLQTQMEPQALALESRIISHLQPEELATLLKLLSRIDAVADELLGGGLGSHVEQAMEAMNTDGFANRDA